MPNYKITEEVRTTIRRKANEYAERTLDYACAGFPLTTATVQNIVLPAEQVADLRRLSREGIKTIETYDNIRLALLRNILPGIPRGLVVALWLPAEIFVARGTRYSISTTKFDMDEGHYLVPDTKKLTQAEREELAAWVNRVVRAKRLAEILEHAINTLVDEKYIPTTAHLHAFWPALAGLAANAQTGGSTRRYNTTTRQYAAHDPLPWKDRMRNPTRSLRRYQPEPGVRERWVKLIAAADSVLLQGEMLAPYRHPDDTIRVRAEHHEALPTDLDPKLTT